MSLAVEGHWTAHGSPGLLVSFVRAFVPLFLCSFVRGSLARLGIVNEGSLQPVDG